MLTQRLNVMLSEVEASPFNAILRSFTSVQDDKSAKKQTWVNCYIIIQSSPEFH